MNFRVLSYTVLHEKTLWGEKVFLQINYTVCRAETVSTFCGCWRWSSLRATPCTVMEITSLIWGHVHRLRRFSKDGRNVMHLFWHHLWAIPGGLFYARISFSKEKNKTNRKMIMGWDEFWYVLSRAHPENTTWWSLTALMAESVPTPLSYSVEKGMQDTKPHP